MFRENKPYTLRVIELNGEKHYYVSFRDGQANLHEIEVDFEVYSAFRQFEKQDKREKNFFDRHIEHSELTEETLYRRSIYSPMSMDECICKKEFSAAFWLAVGELPEIQRRRFLAYYDLNLSYQQIGKMEGCTARAIEYSVEIAKKKIIEKLKKI